LQIVRLDRERFGRERLVVVISAQEICRNAAGIESDGHDDTCGIHTLYYLFPRRMPEPRGDHSPFHEHD
jgi:hypothetical protein